MTSRNPVVALSKLNPEVYANTIIFLKSFIHLFRHIKIGKNWKPYQTGVVIATQSVWDLQEFYLNNRNCKFLLTGRLTQDCLENLFSSLRTIQPIPTALQFKINLKLVCMAQYMKTVSKSSYDEDGREFLGDFLQLTTDIHDQSDEPEPEVLFNENQIKLCNTELNALYNIAGKKRNEQVLLWRYSVVN